MRSWNPVALAGVAAVLGASAALAAGTPLGSDYAEAGPRMDDAGPQIDALVHGEIGRFFSEQSFLGPVSLVVRAPFAALAELGDGTVLGQYRLGAFPCLLALGLAALVLAQLAIGRGARPWHAGVFLGVLLLSGPAIDALRAGHPEEMLTTAFVLLAVAAVAAERDTATGVLLGLAVATKPWAALAVVPVAVASRSWIRTALTAGAVGAALLLPMALVDSGAFRDAARGANHVPHIRPLDVWWLAFSDRGLPGMVDDGIRPALLALSAGIGLLAGRRGPVGVERLLAALALVFLLRCMLDPGDNAYYHVPFIAALGAWELAARRRPPLLALVVGVVLFHRFQSELGYDNDVRSAVYLAWSVPLAAYLALALRRSYAPARVAPA